MQVEPTTPAPAPVQENLAVESERVVEPEPEPEPSPVAEAEPAPGLEAQVEGPPEPMNYAPLKDFHKGGIQLEVTRRVDTGLLPKSVEVSPDGKTIWVCNFGRVDVDNLWVYDAVTLKKTAVVEFPGNAVETIWSPDHKTVYVSNFKRAVVEVIDAQTYKLKSEIKVGFNPKIMVATPDGKFLYVANWSSNDVTVVDLATGNRVRRLKTGKHPRGMALHSDGRLFVNAMFSHQIHEFGDPPAKDGAATVHKSCRYPRHSILSPDEDRLYVTCSGADKVYWYAPDGMKRMGWAKVGDNPRSMAMSDNGRFLAVADFDSSTLSLVDVREGTYDTFELPGAKKVVGVALAPGDELVVYATSWLSGELIELRPVTQDPEPAKQHANAATP